VLGRVLPSSLHLERAAPLTFLLLLLPMLTTRAARTAAVVGGTVAVAGSGLPLGSGLLAGALAGVVAADWVAESHA
jgi:predicted branched-subunit amino acid permease